MGINTCLTLYCREQCSCINYVKHKVLILVKWLVKFTRVFIPCHKTLRLSSLKILGFFVFNTGVVVSNLKLKAENMPPKRSTFISLYAYDASAMASVILKKPTKEFWNLSKHWNVIRFRAIADTLYIHVSVALIEKGKNRFLRSFWHLH